MPNRCFACMQSMQPGERVCSYCRHDSATVTPQSAYILPPGTVCKERFLLGLPIERNGESIVYICYDMQENRRVRLREFYPDTLCHRTTNMDVIPNTGSEIQFKALMTDFVELVRQLSAINAGSSIVRALDIFSAHGTIFAVYEHVEGITLSTYLRHEGGELSWDTAEALFMPLFYGIKALNSAGIIHRGISPETIIVTPENELKLKAICTSAVRAINTELDPELFAGYAAPEQYQKCSSHGEWTDLYAICAVLYRVLTGSAPARADLREKDDDIVPPRKLNPAIPKNVSEAIMNGLAYDKADRTWYIKDLISDLYAKPSERNIDTGKEVPQPLKRRSRFRIPVWLIVVLITLPIMLVAFFMLYKTILGDSPIGGESSSSSGTSSTTSSDMMTSMPSSDTSSDIAAAASGDGSSAEMVVVQDFRGKFYEDIEATATYMKWFKFKVVEKYSDTLGIGEVTDQSIEPNELVEIGTEIELTVSKGAQSVLIPPITDGSGVPITPEDYQKYLIDNGIAVKVERIDSLNVSSGQIDSLSVEPGTLVDREKVKEITMYIAN